jgi:hypothetical protein
MATIEKKKERKRGKKEERKEGRAKVPACNIRSSAAFVLSLLFHLSMSL